MSKKSSAPVESTPAPIPTKPVLNSYAELLPAHCIALVLWLTYVSQNAATPEERAEAVTTLQHIRKDVRYMIEFEHDGKVERFALAHVCTTLRNADWKWGLLAKMLAARWAVYGVKGKIIDNEERARPRNTTSVGTGTTKAPATSFRFLGLSLCPIKIESAESLNAALAWYDAKQAEVVDAEKACHTIAADLLKEYAAKKAELAQNSAELLQEGLKAKAIARAEQKKALLAQLEAEEKRDAELLASLSADDKPKGKGKGK